MGMKRFESSTGRLVGTLQSDPSTYTVVLDGEYVGDLQRDYPTQRYEFLYPESNRFRAVKLNQFFTEAGTETANELEKILSDDNLAR